jgi:uncharacterized protein
MMKTHLQDNEARLQEAQTLVHQYIQMIIKKDLASWIELWDEQCVLELPFAPQGRPQRIEGKAALFQYVQEVIANTEIVGISHQEVYLTQEPDLIIVEIAGEGRIPSIGRSYQAGYVWLMRTHEGKLSHVRDYWNPLATVEARKQA